MELLDIALIKKKSIKGIIALTSRTFALQVVAFSATFLLTIFLSPAIFGVFYVVSAIISFLGYFSDIGLAAALIQKKEELSQDDLKTTFTIQQALVGAVVVFSLLFSYHIAQFYRLDDAGLWLLRSLIISFFLSSLKTIPSVLLERKLEFHKLVIPQILETVSFYIVAVVLAWSGWGVTSFTWAVLTRGIVGLASMYMVSPWQIQIGIVKGEAKKLLKFGLPFQLNSFLALIKDDLLTVFLGKILSFSEIGYIGWAKKWAEVPLRLILDSVVRVTFPAFSRLQHSKEVLGKALDNTVFALAFTMFPMTVVLLYFVSPMVHIVPRYAKWEPALLSFYLLGVTAAIAGLSTPLTNALNAVGKISITLWLMVLWVTTTWLGTVIFIHLFGFLGFSIALFGVAAGTILLVVKLTQTVAPFSFVRCIISPLLGSVVQGSLYQLFFSGSPYSIPRLISGGFVGVILYGGVVWLMDQKRIQHLFMSIRTSV